MLNCSRFQSFVSDPVKRDPILDQFSMITRRYTRLNGLKALPFPAEHTRIANIWKYPPGIVIFVVATTLVFYAVCAEGSRVMSKLTRMAKRPHSTI